MLYCTECEKEYESGKYCTVCGTRLSDVVEVDAGKEVKERIEKIRAHLKAALALIEGDEAPVKKEVSVKKGRGRPRQFSDKDRIALMYKAVLDSPKGISRKNLMIVGHCQGGTNFAKLHKKLCKQHTDITCARRGKGGKMVFFIKSAEASSASFPSKQAQPTTAPHDESTMYMTRRKPNPYNDFMSIRLKEYYNQGMYRKEAFKRARDDWHANKGIVFFPTLASLKDYTYNTPLFIHYLKCAIKNHADITYRDVSQLISDITLADFNVLLFELLTKAKDISAHFGVEDKFRIIHQGEDTVMRYG